MSKKKIDDFFKPISSTDTSSNHTITGPQIPLEDENSVDFSKPKDNAAAYSNISASAAADSTSDCSNDIDIGQLKEYNIQDFQIKKDIIQKELESMSSFKFPARYYSKI